MTMRGSGRGRLLGRTLGALVWVAVATAGTAAAELGSGTSSPLASYRLHEGDRLSVSVGDWKSISGEYAVGLDGTVSLPMIGHVQARGRTAREVEAEIADRATSVLRSPNVLVVVDIVQYTPIYVVGQVNAPGLFFYRRPITVLHAIAMAGGQPKLKDIPEHVLTLANARAERKLLRLQWYAALAEETRLVAQQEGADDFSLTAPLAQAADNPAVRAMIEAERRILQQQRRAEREQLAARDEALGQFEKEKAAARIKAKFLEESADKVAKDLALITAAGRDGYMPRREILQVELALAQARAERNDVDAGIARADQNAQQVERRVMEVRQQTQRQTLADLRKAGERRREIEQSLAAAEAKIETIEGAVRLLPPMTTADEKPRIEIVRFEGTKAVVIPADDLTLVLPGDVVRVLPPDTPEALGDDRSARSPLAGAEAAATVRRGTP